MIKKLLIFIPTYNRPAALRKCLGTIIPQSKIYEDRLRILVNDNDSPGNVNDSITSEFNFKNLFFRKNPSNIGANANMNLGFIFAEKDEFLWILGDDDYLVEDGLDKIFATNGDLDLILMTHATSEIYTNYSIEKSYKDWMSFWVSANIFNMKTFGEFIGSVFYYHNTSFPHAAIQWSAAMERQLKIKLVPLSEVLQRTISQENNTNENYSLAWTGAFGLASILDEQEGSKFVIYWLRKYGINFFQNRTAEPEIFSHSIAIIKNMPLNVRFFYFKSKFRFYIYSIGFRIKNKLVDKDGNLPLISKSLLLRLQRFIVKENTVSRAK
jgi:glycosyltransferase involved in cell wall biosynthesis